MRSRLATFLCCTLGVAFAASTASAEDFRFVRPGSPDRIFKSNEALYIELPANLASSELNSIFIELNGVDITQLVTIQGRNVVFNPSSPYASGSQALRLVRMGKNGKLVEINRWNFSVSGEPPVESATSFSGTVDSTYSYMPWNSGHDYEHPKRHNFNTQAQFQGATQTEGWQMTARGNAYLNTEDNYNPAGSNIEVGEYLLSAEKATETGSTLLRLGNHDVGVDNILMNSFYRRGASAKVDMLGDSVTMTGFSQDPAPRIGNRNIVGFSEEDQRASGVHATARPVAGLGEKLELEGTAYTGRGTQGGTGGTTGIDLPQTSGNGYQFGMRSVLWENYLSMRLQQAYSQFDFDGRHNEYGAQNDDGQRFSFNLTPLGAQVSSDGRLQLWNVELAYQKMGAFYESLLSQMEEGDREKYSVGTNYIYGGTTLSGEVAWITTNVNDFAELPTDRALNSWVQASYAPEEEWWGHPVFFAGGTYSDEGREKTPAGYAGIGLDRTTQSLNAGTSLSFDEAVGTLNHTFTKQDDNKLESASYYTHYTDLTVEFKPLESLTLRPGVQMEWLTQTGTGESRSAHASLGADIVMIPDTLWNYTNYSTLINGGGSSTRSNTNLESEFTWQVKPAEINSPGYALALAGMYGNLTDPDTNQVLQDKDARVFLRLKVSAPFAY